MRRPARVRLLGALVLFAVAAAAWAAEVVVENWKEQPVGFRGLPKGWKEPTWGRPNYELFSISDVSGRSLHMKSRGDSSSIAKDITGTVNIKLTPILQWSWMMVELPRGGDSRRAATDDQAGQLYVVWRRFPELIRSRVIGYVWDSNAPAGEIVKSQKAGTVTYVIVRSGPSDVGRWVTEQRNVVEDFTKIYGER